MSYYIICNSGEACLSWHSDSDGLWEYQGGLFAMPTEKRQVVGRNGYGDYNNNGERFVDFCKIQFRDIGGTLFEHRA